MNCSRILFGGLGTETHGLTASTGLFTLSLNGQSQIQTTTLVVNVHDSHYIVAVC